MDARAAWLRVRPAALRRASCLRKIAANSRAAASALLPSKLSSRLRPAMSARKAASSRIP